jgi:hypothetical protein
MLGFQGSKRSLMDTFPSVFFLALSSAFGFLAVSISSPEEEARRFPVFAGVVRGLPIGVFLMPDIGATWDVEGTVGRGDLLKLIEDGRFWVLSRILIVVVAVFVVMSW